MRAKFAILLCDAPAWRDTRCSWSRASQHPCHEYVRSDFCVTFVAHARAAPIRERRGAVTLSQGLLLDHQLHELFAINLSVAISISLLHKFIQLSLRRRAEGFCAEA